MNANKRFSKLPKAANCSSGKTGLSTILHDSRFLFILPSMLDKYMNDLEMNLSSNQNRKKYLTVNIVQFLKSFGFLTKLIKVNPFQ